MKSIVIVAALCMITSAVSAFAQTYEVSCRSFAPCEVTSSHFFKFRFSLIDPNADGITGVREPTVSADPMAALDRLLEDGATAKISRKASQSAFVKDFAINADELLVELNSDVGTMFLIAHSKSDSTDPNYIADKYTGIAKIQSAGARSNSVIEKKLTCLVSSAE